jgi:hypothetical protein
MRVMAGSDCWAVAVAQPSIMAKMMIGRMVKDKQGEW